MIAVLLAAFLIYLYTPHLLFKFAAANQYDFLESPKGLPQVEEFFNAGLPSAILNGVTFAVLHILDRGVVVDRAVVAKVFNDKPDLSGFVEAGNLRPFLTYLVALAFTSYVAGHIYGRSASALALAGGYWPYMSRGTWLRPFRFLIAAYKSLWSTFYAKFEHPIYPQILRRSWAFVHTNNGLYHGQLFAYEADTEGNLTGLYLLSVSRFSRKTEQECFAAGENPIRTLTGPLFIKWSEILDINYPPGPETLEQKRKYYDQKVREFRARPSWSRIWRFIVRRPAR